MRVLLTHRPAGAFGYISDGWLNAFRSVGHAAERWDGSRVMWQSFNPDLYLGCSAHQQPIPSRRDGCKIAIHVNPYGPIDIPRISSPIAHVKWTVAQHPDVVFGYGHATDEKFWSYWPSKCGIQWIPMPTAADIILFRLEQVPKQYDLAYVGGWWSYKASRIDEWLLPLFKGGLSYKLYGFGKWPGVECLPPIASELVSKVLAGSRVGPCVNEPHIAQYGFDLAERIFKVAAVGTVVVHDNIPGLDRYMPSAVIAECPEQFQSLCKHYAHTSQDGIVRAIIERQWREILGGQTYHHRLAGLLSALGFNHSATEMQNYIRDIF